jgi:hypothetical protein
VSLDQCSDSASCSINAADYDQACHEDSDCVAAFSGSFCGSNACACENAAINVSAQAQYSADLERDNAPRCPCPSPPPVACNQGTCGLRAALQDGGAD